MLINTKKNVMVKICERRRREEKIEDSFSEIMNFQIVHVLTGQ